MSELDKSSQKTVIRVEADGKVMWEHGVCGRCGQPCVAPTIDVCRDPGAAPTALVKSACEQRCRYLVVQARYGEEMYRIIEEDTRREESKMSRSDVIASRMRELEEEQARLAALPKEPIAWDAVVWFQKSFGRAEHELAIAYTYAATKTGNGKWYVTGRGNPNGYDWDGLLEFVQQGESDDIMLYVAKSWDELGAV